MKLMPGICKHIAPGGNAILSGLLDELARGICAMATAQGLRLIRRSALGARRLGDFDFGRVKEKTGK